LRLHFRLDVGDARDNCVLFVEILDLVRVRKVGDVQRLVHLEVRDVRVDVRRNVSGQALDLDLVQSVKQDAARVLDARGGADELHGNGDAHLLVHRDALEVNVQQVALDGLVLPVDDHRLAGGAALDREIEDGVVAGIGVEDAGDDFGIDRNGDRGLARTVDDGGDEAFAANAACVVLVELAGARLGGDGRDGGVVCHEVRGPFIGRESFGCRFSVGGTAT